MHHTRTAVELVEAIEHDLRDLPETPARVLRWLTELHQALQPEPAHVPTGAEEDPF